MSSRLPTVLLRHETVSGCHHDWLLTDPAEPDGLLWTARVQPATEFWAKLGQWDVEPIARHRRIYLTFEGTLSGGRGTVRPVDEGFVTALLWQPGHMVLDLKLQQFRGRVELVATGPKLLRATAMPP
jgi:hypothetical protein